MRPILKFGLGLLAVIVLIESLWFALLVEPTMRRTIELMQWQYEQEWVSWTGVILAVIVALLALSLLLIAIFKPATTSRLSVSSDKGQLNLSRNAIEKSLRYAIQQNHPVTEVVVHVQLQERKQLVTAKVNATLRNLTTDLVSEGQAIKETAQQELAQRLGLKVKQVTVHLVTADKRTEPISSVV